MKEKGRILTVSGGSIILEELSFAENGNAAFYSGYDTLPTASQDVLSAAQFSLKQAAVPVTITGLEKLQNSGKEEMIDLMSARLNVAEATLANIVTQGCYGDGTAWGGKSLVGLDAASSPRPPPRRPAPTAESAGPTSPSGEAPAPTRRPPSTRPRPVRRS
jgi:hypothetical protein